MKTLIALLLSLAGLTASCQYAYPPTTNTSLTGYVGFYWLPSTNPLVTGYCIVQWNNATTNQQPNTNYYFSATNAPTYGLLGTNYIWGGISNLPPGSYLFGLQTLDQPDQVYSPIGSLSQWSWNSTALLGETLVLQSSGVNKH